MPLVMRPKKDEKKDIRNNENIKFIKKLLVIF